MKDRILGLLSGLSALFLAVSVFVMFAGLVAIRDNDTALFGALGTMVGLLVMSLINKFD